MANLKISEMVSASTIAGDELIPIVLSGTNKSITPNILRNGLATEELVSLLESRIESIVGFEDLYSYGVEWDTTVSSPILTRIGNPLLHKSLPILSAYKGCVANGSEIVYYLDPNDWNFKAERDSEGNLIASVLDGTDGTVRVHTPKFYGKSGSKGTKKWVKISTIKIDDTWTEVPELLIDAYHCTVDRTDTNNLKTASVVNTTPEFRGGTNRTLYDLYLTTELETSDPFRSDLGKPRTNISRANMRKYAQNAGSELLCYEFYKWVFYWAYMIEYANFNTQAGYNAALTSDGYRQGGLGNGVTNMSNWAEYNSCCPITPCGYGNELGNFTGIKEIPALNYNYPTTATTNINNYSKDTSAATITGTTNLLTITNVNKINARYAYTAYTKQTGLTTYTISGLQEGQTIEFYTNNTVIATASVDGDIDVVWPNTVKSDRNLRSLFTGECNITISIKNAISELVALSRPVIKMSRWRGFDNPFGDIWNNLDGVILKRDVAQQDSKVYTTPDSSLFGDSQESMLNMNIAGIEKAGDGWIRDYDLGATAEIIPSAVGGSSFTYMCDYHSCNPSTTALRTLLVGGHAIPGSYAGFGYLSSHHGVGDASTSVGFRTLNRINSI